MWAGIEKYNSYSSLSITAAVAPIHFSLIILLHLLRSTASLGFMCKSFTSLSSTSFHVYLGQPLCLAPHLRTNTLYHQSSSSSSFVKTRPYHRDLFLWTTFTMSSNPNCCLNSTQDSLSFNFTPHIHLIIFISVRCNASLFSLFNDHVSSHFRAGFILARVVRVKNERYR